MTYHQSDCPLSAQRRPYLIGRAERGCALQGQRHVSAYFNFLQRPSVLSRWKSQRSVISRYQTAAIVRAFEKSPNFAGIRKAARLEFLHPSRAACPNRIFCCAGGGKVCRMGRLNGAYILISFPFPHRRMTFRLFPPVCCIRIYRYRQHSAYSFTNSAACSRVSVSLSFP